MTVGEKILAWLDEIGADGLISTLDDASFYDKNHIEQAGNEQWLQALVPAFRHADGTWHTEKENPCAECYPCDYGICVEKNGCDSYQSWLSHKEN